MEKIRASLFNSSDLIGLSSLDGEEELMELSSEEILTASTVNQSLFDTQGSSALEDYFLDKSLRGWWLNNYYNKIVRTHHEEFSGVFIDFAIKNKVSSTIFWNYLQQKETAEALKINKWPTQS